MSKKNIITLTIAIILLIGAIAIFLYMNSLKSKNNNTTTPEISQEENNPSFYFYDIDGKKFDLTNFSDKPTIMLFWKSDVSSSFDMIELLEKYYDENKNLVNFVTINVNEPDLKIVQNVKTAEFTIPMYFDTDSTVNTKYNVDTLPHIFFIEEDGTISKEFTSNITEDAFTANLDLLEKNY